MGPVIYTGDIWPPVEPTDRPPRGELEGNRDKDRRFNRSAQRRKHREESNPDADQFTRKSEEPGAQE
jgi:hypothetical protein